MRIDHRLLSWGVFFIALGSIPLAVHSGAVDSAAFADAWRLWPLVFVGIGVGIILRGSRVAVLGGVIVALTFGIAFGSVLAGGSFDLGAIACGSNTASGPTTSRTGAFPAVATVELETRCGNLSVHTVPGSGWSLSAVTSADLLPGIAVDSDQLSAQSGGEGTFFPGFWAAGERERWDVGLPADSTIGLSVTIDAGEGSIDLSGGTFGKIGLTVNAGTAKVDAGSAQVAAIRVRVNAGDARIVLPDTSLTGDFTVNAGSVRLCTATDVGIRIQTNENITASYDFANSGLVKDGSTWISPNYGSARVSMILSVTANAGSVSLNPKDGCR